MPIVVKVKVIDIGKVTYSKDIQRCLQLNLVKIIKLSQWRDRWPLGLQSLNYQEARQHNLSLHRVSKAHLISL